MPEGPEIRRAADRIATYLLHRRLVAVTVSRNAFPTLAARQDDLVGQKVVRVDTHGKGMLTRLDSNLTIYTHNQLYGRWLVCDRGKEPPTNRSLRLALHTKCHSALLYSASTMEWLTPGQLKSHGYLSKLGPDLLSANLDASVIRERASLASFRGRSLAVVLLDQRFVAGVGNYLRSEILFAARLDPWRRARDLSDAELRRFGSHLLSIGERAYRTGGITISRQQYNEQASHWREACSHEVGNDDCESSAEKQKEACRFAVFKRENATCYVCETVIAKVNFGSQPLYYCRSCQNVAFPN